jgi:hypothetical protein
MCTWNLDEGSNEIRVRDCMGQNCPDSSNYRPPATEDDHNGA